jgi:multidrug resistance efflux pump
MDKRELEWRLASLDAEYHRARKQRDSSLATRETSSAQVARLEMERLNGERKLLRNQLTKLEIRSPIDGMVLAGDPKKLEGARLTIGQSLFETGPLDRMLVEVFVPDDEIAFLQSGNDVSVRLDALPLRTFTGTIRRVNPKSESRNNQNVFIAEVVLENPDRLLRPGMNGRARISTPAQMLGWNLFRKPIVRLVRLVRW